MNLTAKNAESLIQGFKNLKVLIIGDIMIDSYLWGNTERISPEAPVPVVHVLKKEHRLGGAANVALNIKALGAKPVICTITGADEMAMIFHELLQKREMTDVGIINSVKRVTSQKTRVISHNQQIVRIDEENAEYLDKEDENKLIERITDLMDRENPDVIIFEDYNKGVLTANLISATIDEAVKRGIPTSVDPKKQNFFAYKNATFFKPNLKEFTEGLKLNDIPSSQEDWLDGIRRLRAVLNHSITFVTLSEKGVLIEKDEEIEMIPAHLRNIADVSGAGDTVISVASLCLASGASKRLIAELSNLAGGLVCERAGVVPIEKEQLLNEVRKFDL